MEVKTILVLEDDVVTLKMIKGTLEKHGFRIAGAQDETSADEILSTQKINAAILDLNLPDTNGIEFLKKIRNHPVYNFIPILILTSNDDKMETVLALEIGADDYITKPFNSRELIARLNARLRRSNKVLSKANSTFTFGDLVIDQNRREVTLKGREIKLTYNEYELLLYLARNAGNVLPRETLLNHLWGEYFTTETRTVDIHISALRKKIENKKENLVFIETIRGVGYRFIK